MFSLHSFASTPLKFLNEDKQTGLSEAFPACVSAHDISNELFLAFDALPRFTGSREFLFREKVWLSISGPSPNVLCINEITFSQYLHSHRFGDSERKYFDFLCGIRFHDERFPKYTQFLGMAQDDSRDEKLCESEMEKPLYLWKVPAGFSMADTLERIKKNLNQSGNVK